MATVMNPYVRPRGADYVNFEPTPSLINLLVDDETLPIDEILYGLERDARIRLWINTLSPRLRQIFHLLYVEEQTHAEVAATVGVSRARVSQLHRQMLDLGRSALAYLN